jgi:hypothetical protein
MKRFASFVFAVAASSAPACSSSSAPTTQPCNENPWECPAGQTCWPTASGSFECLNSGPGKAGSPCLDSAGVATCGDGLACLATDATNGSCTPYCDNTNPNHACPAGLVCDTIQLAVSGGAQFQACGGGTGTTEAGAGDSGATDSGAPDSGATDSGARDSGASDTGAGDSGTSTGAADSGTSPYDGGVLDGTVMDSGIVI